MYNIHNIYILTVYLQGAGGGRGGPIGTANVPALARASARGCPLPGEGGLDLGAQVGVGVCGIASESVGECE